LMPSFCFITAAGKSGGCIPGGVHGDMQGSTLLQTDIRLIMGAEIAP
jgi:hypothetical protein